MLTALHCLGCKGEPRLEAHRLQPVNSPRNITVIACGKCGVVVGVVDDAETNEILKRLDDLANLIKSKA